jgi:hypothetical protein
MENGNHNPNPNLTPTLMEVVRDVKGIDGVYYFHVFPWERRR